jgi:hypothetical protein
MIRSMTLVAMLALTACAGSRSTQVGASMILPPQARMMKMEQQQLFLMANHLNPEHLPDYPAPQMAAGPERARVCVDLVVSEAGEVVWAVPLHGGPDCPATAEPALVPFEQAALAAVREWRFTAAAVCTFPPGIEKNDDCEGEGVTERAVPLRMAFTFDFSRHEGRGRFARSAGG